MDLNRTPDHRTPKWSETRWNGCFNPDAGVGLFLHAGRHRGHLDWWWVQTAVYLPDRRVAVERSWVHRPGPTGVQTASLELRAEPEGWSARFHGIAQLTTTDRLATAARGSSAPSVPVSFTVSGDAGRPLWDMNSTSGNDHDFADLHLEQIGRSTGTLSVGDETYSLAGVSYHDHSSGPRDWTSWAGHHFAAIAMPELTIHQIGIWAPDGTLLDPIGIWMPAGDEPSALASVTVPRLETLLGEPLRYPMTIRPAGGAEQRFDVEILHTFPTTVTEDNDNINGVDWDLSGDPIVFIECQARVTGPDGSVGYGHIERSARRNTTPRPMP